MLIAPSPRCETFLVSELKEALARRAEEVARALYPHAKKEGRYIVVGDIHGAPGKSFRIAVDGQWAGMARDWSDSSRACSLIDCYMAVRGASFKEAAAELSRWMGTSTLSVLPNPPKHSPRPPAKPVQREKPRPWSSKVEEQYYEGWIFAEDNLGSLAKELAEYRGWPVESCVELLAEGVIAQVLDDYGYRIWAFPVAVPTADGQLTIGIHKRSRPPKKEWFFSAGAISVPFILGDPASAKTFLITEGQWDALSISIAMSPSSPHQVQREDLAIVGIRGVDGVGRFLEFYGDRLKGSTCIVILDSDEAGMKWAQHDGFLTQLSAMADTRAFKAPCGAKDCNDAFRAGDLTQDVVQAWLHGGVA